MVAIRVLVVSDSHLSPRTPEAVANWDSVVAHIATDRPDIVVHTGDVSTDGARVGGDLAFARAQVDRIVRPHYVLPGNHDLGDNPHPGNSPPGAPRLPGNHEPTTAADRGGGPGAPGDPMATATASAAPEPTGAGARDEPTSGGHTGASRTDTGIDAGFDRHDTGRGGHEPLVGAERLARYRDHLAPDRWTVDIPGWRLIGLNALLFGSGLDDEGEQWAWLDEQVGGVGRRRRIGLFVHKPVVPAPDRPDDSAATSPGRYVAAAARDRLLAVGPRLVVSGHTHQFRRHRTGGAAHVWVPSTWAVIPDRFQVTLGDKACGVVELVLHEDGVCETELMLPYGIVQQAVVDDVADPYAHRRSYPR
jgi:3',5'-cyclic AMP phosphodiesterase CpdA